MGAYEFIKSAHPFFPQIESLRTALASELQPAEDKGHSRSLLRIDFDQGRLQLKWAYVSKQSCASDRFQATTYLYRSKRDRVERHEFPSDPKLQDIGSVLDEFAERWSVLRIELRNSCGAPNCRQSSTDSGKLNELSMGKPFRFHD
jgi:hypothetical protein